MVLRAGVILPFQYGDVKKLLMVGSPEEDRNLKLYDFTNVVRAAFNIYNRIEFRNKKIDFQIPEELLVSYLEQCKDLTNFVIQIEQAVNSSLFSSSIEHAQHPQCPMSIEPSCSQSKPTTTYVQKPPMNENDSNNLMRANFAISSTTLPSNNGDLSSPLDVTSHSDHSMSNNAELPSKIRRAQFYADRTPESLTQSIDPNDIMPKTEQDDHEFNMKKAIQRQQIEEQQQQHQPQQLQTTQQPPHFFPNYAQSILGSSLGAPSVPTATVPLPNNSHSQIATNRFRRRGERMSKDQKEMYVKFFEENPCMLQQRRNDAALAPLWNKLAGLLNNVQQGAVKNVEEWKQTFDAWRYRVFMYSRYNSKLSGEAAQNPKNYKPLTSTDQRAYAMWTSHRSANPTDYDKMDMFAALDETQADDYDY